MGHLRRLLPYLRPYRRQYVFGLILVLVATALAAVMPLLLKMAVDGLEQGIPFSTLAWISGTILGLAVLRSVFQFRGRYTIISTARHVEYDLRNDLYGKLLRLPARFFDRHSTGDIASRVINDIEGIRMIAGISIQILGGTSLLFLFAMGMMFSFNPKVAVFFLIPLLLVVAVTALLTRQIYARSKEVQDRLADISDTAQENFSGARVVRAFTQEKAELRKFSERSGEYRDANLRLALVRGSLYGLMNFFIQAALAVTLVIGGVGIIHGTFSKGELVAFTAYLFMLVWPVIAIGWVVTLFQRGSACMGRLIEILDAEPEEPAEPDRKEGPGRGEIEIRNLTFQYSEDREPAVRDLSLKVRPGERVAIVGRTGAGKSTLIQILLGLYAPPKGTVFLDGLDIGEYRRQSLRESIGSVPQDTFLFSDTLSNNIAFGGHNGVTDDKIRRAAEISQIARDAEGFPEGLEQVVGERGITLSGGQKQRTAIARAVIREPSILLLDDALSSVDVHTERMILDELDSVLRDRTCVIVTHRFSVVQKVDRVIVMDAGRVVEQGTHDELMKNAGLYAKLVERQRLVEALEN